MDASLIDHARRGDGEAFATLVAPLEKRLYRTALAILANPADAEDAWQNTVLRTFRGLRGLRRPDHFATWMTRILINECRQILRRRRPWLSLTDVTPSLPEPDPEQTALRQALLGLSGEQRMAVFLRFWLDLPIAEVAEVLEVPLPTAKSRLYQALKNLRQTLGEEDKG